MQQAANHVSPRRGAASTLINGAATLNRCSAANGSFALWYGPKTAAGAGSAKGPFKLLSTWRSWSPPSGRGALLDGPRFPDDALLADHDFVASRSEYTFWSLWSAPLLVATDVRALSEQKRQILLNREVIAINQDESATAGNRLRSELRAHNCGRVTCKMVTKRSFFSMGSALPWDRTLM